MGPVKKATVISRLEQSAKAPHGGKREGAGAKPHDSHIGGKAGGHLGYAMECLGKECKP